MASAFKELTVNMCFLRKLENALHSERMETWAMVFGLEGPPLWISFHLSSRVIHQRVGVHSKWGMSLTAYKVPRAVNQGIKPYELQRKINLLNKWKFFFLFPNSSIGVQQAGREGTEKHFNVTSFKGIHNIYNSQRKIECFHLNSYIETCLQCICIFIFCARDSKLIESKIWNNKLWNQTFLGLGPGSHTF